MFHHGRIIWMALVLAVGCLNAQTPSTQNLSVAGATLSMTVSGPDDWEYNLHAELQRNEGTFYTGLSIIEVPENGSNTNIATIHNEHSIHTGWGSSPWTVIWNNIWSRNPAKWYRVRLYKSLDNNTIVDTNVIWLGPVPYSVTVNIPANTSTGPIRYAVMQGGEQIAQHSTLPGDAAYEMTVETATNSPVTVQVVKATMHYIPIPDTSPQEYSLVESGNEVVYTLPKTYTPTAGPGTVVEMPPVTSAPISPVEIKPAPVAPEAPSPTTVPTPTGPSAGPATPVYKDLPWTTPSGTTGASTQDVQELGNALVDAVNKQMESDHENASSVVTAVNAASSNIVTALGAVIAATDTNTTSANASGTAILEELGNIRKVLEASAPGGGGGGAGAGGPGYSDAWGEANQAAAKAVTDGSGYKAAAEAAVGGLTVPTITGEYAGTEPDLTYEMPSLFGGMTVDMNPFRSDRFGPIAAWMRTAASWLAIVLFAVWLTPQLKADIIALYTAPQAKGNTIAAGTGAQATAAAAALAITTIVITASVALMSWFYGDMDLGMMAAAMSSNPAQTLASSAVWVIDQVIPIATVLICLLAKVSYPLYAMYVYAGAATLIRWVVP